MERTCSAPVLLQSHIMKRIEMKGLIITESDIRTLAEKTKKFLSTKRGQQVKLAVIVATSLALLRAIK